MDLVVGFHHCIVFIIAVLLLLADYSDGGMYLSLRTK
jgi:hypothetical protein